MPSTLATSASARDTVRYCNRADLGVAAFRGVFGSTLYDRYGPVCQSSQTVRMCEGRFGLEPCDCIKVPLLKIRIEQDHGGSDRSDPPSGPDTPSQPQTQRPTPLPRTPLRSIARLRTALPMPAGTHEPTAEISIRLSRRLLPGYPGSPQPSCAALSHPPATSRGLRGPLPRTSS